MLATAMLATKKYTETLVSVSHTIETFPSTENNDLQYKYKILHMLATNL